MSRGCLLLRRPPGWRLPPPPPRAAFSLAASPAILVALLAAFGRAPRALLVSWNALGIVLLTGILGLALASTPAIHAFGTDPKSLNTFVAYVPFVWLPAVFVVAAIIGHISLTRRLLLSPRA